MPRPDQSQERREEFLPLIAAAFAELGYRRTTTAELGRRCGVRENVLFRLWENKKAMFLASIEHVFHRSSGIWSELLKRRDPRQTPAEWLLNYEADHLGEFGLYRIIFAGLNEDDEEIREALRDVYRRFHDFIQDQIADHNRKGRAAAAPSADLLAWGFVGLGTIANIARELGMVDPARRGQLMKQVGKVLLNGEGK